jgi:hypothetical protein
MKKLLVFALVLVFTGAAVFAVDFGNGFTLGGEVKAGVGVTTQNDGNDGTKDTTAVVGPDGLSAGLTLGYEDEKGGAKAKFTLNGKAGTSEVTVSEEVMPEDFSATVPAPSVNYDYAFGWINLLEKKIVIHGGKIDPSLWGTGGVVDKKFDNVTGVRAAFYVVEGLNFGFALPLATAAEPIGDAFGKLVLGAKYTAADMLGMSVAASLRLNPVKEVYTGDKWETMRPSFVEGLFMFEIKPIDVLTVNLTAYLNTAKDKDDDGKSGGVAWVGPKVTYAANGLTAFGQANIKLLLGDYAAEGVAAGDVPKYLKPGKDGAEGDKASVGFKVGASYKVDLAKPYLEIDSANLLFLTATKDDRGDDAGLNVKLGTELALGTCTLDIFDKISGIAKYKPEGEGVKDPISNSFEIRVKWAF